MTWLLVLRAQCSKSTLARRESEAQRNRAEASPLPRFLSSCKQGPSCWHNELSWWAGGFLQLLGLKISCWLKEAFGEMYRTLGLWIICEIYLFSIQIGNWSFMHIRIQQKPVPFAQPSFIGYTEGDPRKVNNATSLRFKAQARLCRLLIASAPSFYHLSAFPPDC